MGKIRRLRKFLKLPSNSTKDPHNSTKTPIQMSIHNRYSSGIFATKIMPEANRQIKESTRTCAKSSQKSNKTQECSNMETSPKAQVIKTPLQISELTRPTTKAFTTQIFNKNYPLPHSNITTRITIDSFKKTQVLAGVITSRRLRIFIKSKTTLDRHMPRKWNK
jgi:hypothetical protein